MIDRHRSTPRRRGVAAALAAGLALVGAVTATAWWGPVSAAPDGARAATFAPAPQPEGSSAVIDDFPIPADATDAEREQIKLSYDIVAVPVDQRDEVLSVPGVSAVAPVTVGDTFVVAVPASSADLVRASVPDAVVAPNPVVTVASDETPVPSWGLDVVDNTASAHDDHYLYDSTGAGVTAFVIDSGVQSTHPDFGGRVDAAAGKDFVGDGNGTEDCFGHGTHVAGTIGSTTYGVAKEVRIIPVRVFGCQGQGSGYDILRALDWIYRTYPTGTQSVINMSLGMPTFSYVDAYVNALSDRGFVIAAAAGNDAKDACTSSPASAAKAITTGAYADDNAFAWYSNTGPCVKILAPGSDITSTWIGSQVAVDSGTSMASPHVAGLVARLLLEHPSWKSADVLQYFGTSAATGHITGVPSNTVNQVAAVPGVPRVKSLTATAAASGIALSWTTNGIGTFTTFSLEVTDTTAGRSYPVTVSALRSSTVFTDVVSGHAYTITLTGSARMPSGALVTTDPLTVAGL